MDRKPRMSFIRREYTRTHDELGVLVIGRVAIPFAAIIVAYAVAVIGASLFGAFSGGYKSPESPAWIPLVVLFWVGVGFGVAMLVGWLVSLIRDASEELNS